MWSRARAFASVAVFSAAPLLHADSVLQGSAAVLPFNDASPAPAANVSWLGESVAEALREALVMRGSPVIPRSDVAAAYLDLRLRPEALLTRASALKIGQALNADHTIHGTYRWDPATGTITLEARLSDRGHVQLLGPFSESGPATELDRLEAHLAWQVLQALDRAPDESFYRSLRPPVRVTAEESFIRGLLTKGDDREQLYQQASRSDTRFVRPLLELGKIALERKDYKAAAEWLTKVPARDFHSPEASFYLGVARYHLGDFAGAQVAFQSILGALPLPEVFNNLGAAESRSGQLHALASFREALELNSTHPDYHFNMGYILFKTGQYEAAADRFRAVLERDPSDQMATLLLGRSLKMEPLRAGNSGDARFVNAERFKDSYEAPLYHSVLPDSSADDALEPDAP